MPLPPEHYEPSVVLPDVTKLNKKTETSAVAGGAAPSGYMETFAREGSKAAQQAAGAVGRGIVSVIDPRHYKDNGELDLEATALHGVGDVGAYQLAKAGLNRAVTPNPLASQNEAILKAANIQAETAAANRLHEIQVLAAKQTHDLEMQKLKAAGVPTQTAAPLATALTTPLPSTQGQATTLAELNAARAATAPPAGTPLNPVVAPQTPTVPLNTEVGKEPAGMGLVKAGEENKLKNELAKQKTTPVNPFEGSTELRTGTGKAAYEGMNPEGKLRSTYNSIRDVPKGLAFIPKGQYVDVLRNDLGQPTYTQSFTGRELPTQYRGAPEAAVETAQGINRGLNRETREAMLARGVPKNELPEPTKGILERIGGPKGSKIVNIGGAIGALTAIPNLVHAAQGAEEKDLQKAWGSLVEGAGQFLGPLGAIGGGLFGFSPEELDTLRKSKQSPKIGIPPPR